MSPVLSRRTMSGFTLVEVVIATAVSGVLASVAYPSFSAALAKARRSEAMVAMTQIQLAQERWRSARSRFATLEELGVATATGGGHYLLSVADPTPQGYVATAQASGASERGCRYLRIAYDAGISVYRSGETDATANDAAANRRCWGQ